MLSRRIDWSKTIVYSITASGGKFLVDYSTLNITQLRERLKRISSSNGHDYDERKKFINSSGGFFAVKIDLVKIVNVTSIIDANTAVDEVRKEMIDNLKKDNHNSLVTPEPIQKSCGMLPGRPFAYYKGLFEYNLCENCYNPEHLHYTVPTHIYPSYSSKQESIDLVHFSSNLPCPKYKEDGLRLYTPASAGWFICICGRPKHLHPTFTKKIRRTISRHRSE
jgi:hypothetical protein